MIPLQTEANDAADNDTELGMFKYICIYRMSEKSFNKSFFVYFCYFI